MDRSLLYVSRRSLLTVDSEAAVEEIVAQARLHNAKVGITGALACTTDHFAQLLEGDTVALDDLMHRIELDQRHTDVTILRVEATASRRFAGWSMAYSGSSSYVARQISPLVGGAMDANISRIERLTGLLVGLAMR